MNNTRKRSFRIFLVRTAVVLLAGCGNAPTEDPFGLEDSYQKIRERIVIDFVDNPINAERRYRSVFLQPSRPDAKDLVAKAVVCGQLISKGMRVHISCKSILAQGVKSRNDEVRALVISAMAFAMDEVSQDTLIAALSDSSTIVRLEAAQALNYQLDTLSADPNNPSASSRLRASLALACRSHHGFGTSSLVELCGKAE